ncbi:MAG: hypothetical protein RLZZ555_844 [Pseudomonadota bacterium]|jgi:hypothetical protein
MSAYIVFLASFLSIHLMRRSGLESAFVKAWIPVFLCLPVTFAVSISGLPDPNFSQAAILPLLFVLLRDRLGQMHFGAMEKLLAAYVLVRVFSDFLGRGYSDAQNYGFYMLTSMIGPYLLGRYLVTRREMDIEAARMFVLVFLLFFPMFLFEVKFWVSPVFRMLSGFFPGAGSGLSIRWGLARTAGTFEHPILACIMIIAVYRLHRWLCWQGFWDRPQTGLLLQLSKLTRFTRIPFQHQVTIALVLMALMTMSRGPWIGGLAGAALAATGNLRNRGRWLLIFLVALVIGGVAAKAALEAYITPAEGEMLSGEATTMLYRQVMIDQYKAFLMDKFWTGWGLTTVPKIKGMESVDNAFFLMALQHGVIAPALMVSILLYAIVTQILGGLKAPPGQSPIGFTFAGIYLMCFISFATVYMGAQTEPMIFLLLGWGESIRNRRQPEKPSAAVSIPDPGGGFRRVLR